MKLSEQVALITGASSGIGRGVALAMAREGASVVINYLSDDDRESADGVRLEIEADGSAALILKGDISIESDVRSLVSAAERWRGHLDILVNNAGISHVARTQEMPVATWDQIIAVHLRGTFLMVRAVLPAMIARGRGRIINTVSQLAYKGAPGLCAYTAAKAGVIGFTRTLALELGTSGVTVNCVAPGATQTPLLDTLPKAMIEAIRLSIPTGRIAEVEDIAPAYVFLASADGRHFQGQTISPNGGDLFL